MLTVGTAQELRDAGIEWTPTALDMFVVPLPDLEEQIFVVSDMTILSEQLHGHPALTFHGTVEWALDHVWTGEALWLPREDQLRQMVETQLAAFPDWRLTMDANGEGYHCQMQYNGQVEMFEGRDVSECLAAALLRLLHDAANVAALVTSASA